MSDLFVKKTPTLVTDQSLQDYFIQNLGQLNKKLVKPLENQVLIYSGEVLEKYLFSEKFFEIQAGKIQEKALGVMLLEASMKPFHERRLIIQEVAETSLIVSSYFYQSHKKKILNRDYYLEIGRRAYKSFDKLAPSYKEVNNFFDYIANVFDQVTELIYLASIRHSFQDILKDGVDSKQAALLGLTPLNQEKVS
jgi:hypothetical protein